MDAPPPISPAKSPSPRSAKADHAMLVAGVAVRQAGTYTAMLAERMHRPRARGDMRSALVAMFVAGNDRAAGGLRGSFHPRIAETRARPYRQSS